MKNQGQLSLLKIRLSRLRFIPQFILLVILGMPLNKTVLAEPTASIAAIPRSTPAIPQLPPVAPQSNPAITFNELITIPQTLKDQLDKYIAPIRNNDEKVIALHHLLFDRKSYGVSYQNDYTKTAQEVLTTRSGNCLAIASLFVGAARYVGLNAEFQSVKIPTQWSHATELTIALGHVNVGIKRPLAKTTVEFQDTFSAELVSNYPTKVITDEEALSRYLSNRGAELLGRGQLVQALAMLENAVIAAPKFSDAWVNYGVALKMNGQFAKAEVAYIKANKMGEENLSALTNLHALYLYLGETKKAEKLISKIQNYRLKNPYYLAQLSDKEMVGGNLKGAKEFILKAIHIHDQEPDFQTQLGKIYYKMGKLEEASQAFQAALTMTNDPVLLEKRKQKFEALNRLMAHR